MGYRHLQMPLIFRPAFWSKGISWVYCKSYWNKNYHCLGRAWKRTDFFHRI